MVTDDNGDAKSFLEEEMKSDSKILTCDGLRWLWKQAQVLKNTSKSFPDTTNFESLLFQIPFCDHFIFTYLLGNYFFFFFFFA